MRVISSRRNFLKGIAALGGLTLVGPLCMLEDRPRLTPSVDLPSYATGGVVLPGTILAHYSGFGCVPVGYLPCDGRMVDKDTYPALYQVSTSWNYRLPDLKARSSLGLIGDRVVSVGLSPDYIIKT